MIGDETYQHAAGTYITGSGESGAELLRRRSAGCYASTYIPRRVGHETVRDPSRCRAERRRDDEGRLRGPPCGRLWK